MSLAEGKTAQPPLHLGFGGVIGNTLGSHKHADCHGVSVSYCVQVSCELSKSNIKHSV